MREGTLSVLDTEIVDNRLDGGLAQFGIAILNSGTLSLERCTVAGNRSVYYASAIRSTAGTVSIDSSILWRNGPLSTYGTSQPPISGSATVTNSDVEFGFAGAGNLALDPLFASTSSGDDSLRSGSPCIDAGHPASVPTGLDATGDPRLLDGDLDGAMRVDMGARELGSLTLDVAGDFSPGGAVSVSTGGLAGLAVWLAIGRPGGPTLLAPWGSAFFDLGSSPRVLVLGANPQTQAFTIPPTLVGPLQLVLQAIGFSPVGPPTPGNVSNPVPLTIE